MNDRAIRNIICHIIGKERSDFTMFHSAYEGIAHMEEVVVDICEDSSAIIDALRDTWDEVKQDDNGMMGLGADSISKIAVHLAVEAVKLATMSEKFWYSLDEDEKITLDDGTEAPSFIKGTKLTIKIVDEEDE